MLNTVKLQLCCVVDPNSTL